MDMDLQITRCRREDLKDVASLHMRAFPDAALTSFGAEAVRRYYQWLVEGPHDAALMLAWQGKRLVGFCAAGWFRGAMRGFLRANRLYLAGRVIRHPSLLRTELVRERVELAVRLMWRFSRLGRSSRTQREVPQDVKRFGVLSIATDHEVRRAGVGRSLMAEAEARARAEGYSSMLLTVHPENASAIRFYEGLGWERNIVSEGEWAGTMQKRLT